MALKDVLLHIESYPDPTSVDAVREAVRFAALVGASLTGVAVQVEFNTRTNWLAERLIDFSALAAEQEAKSRAACRSSVAAFQADIKDLNVPGDAVVVSADPYFVGDHVAKLARTRDLCLVPMANAVDGQRSVAEIVAFGSGRPVIFYEAGAGGLLSRDLHTAVVAWDGSRSAARALADALPLLKIAKQVRVLTVLNEKAEATPGLGEAAVAHLGRHGVNALADEVDLAGGKIGEVLEAYVQQHGSDLLVMGAYGHSRFREFILGGATEHLMRRPPFPLFLSH